MPESGELLPPCWDELRPQGVQVSKGIVYVKWSVERCELRWFGHLITAPPGRLPLVVCRHIQMVGGPWWTQNMQEGLNFSSSLGPPRASQEELESVAGDRGVCVTLLSLLSLQPGSE